MINLYRFARLYELELKIEYDNNYDEIVVKFTTKYGNEYIHRIQSYELDSAESEKKMQQLICDWCTEELRLNRKLLKLVNNEKVKKEDINFILLERQYKNEKLDIEKYNEYQEKIFGSWDEWLTAEYEKWDKEYDYKIKYINEYIKDALDIIEKLPDVDYKIVFNKEYRDVPFYLVAVGIKATKKNCERFVVESYDFDEVYYEYADETEDISISLGDGWNHTASISYPY